MTDTIDHHDEDESKPQPEISDKQDLVGGFAFFLSLAALLPSALEEARVLGQEPDIRRLLLRLQPEKGG
jgi:hypothetical protein